MLIDLKIQNESEKTPYHLLENVVDWHLSLSQ